MATAIDYSWSRPPPPEIKAAGYRAVIRYLSYESRDGYPALNGKDIHPTECHALHAEGLEVGLVFQTSASAAAEGYQKGIEHAQVAQVAADRLGWPRDVAIAYAVDFGPTPQQMLGVADYFWGIASVRNRRPIGCYGPYDVIEYLAARIPEIVVFWQCAGHSGFGEGTGGSIRSGYTRPVRLSRHADIFQHYGLWRFQPERHATDHNDLLTPAADRLFWHPDAAHPHPPQEDIPMNAVVYVKGVEGENPDIGWLAWRDKDDRRWRRPYFDPADLVVDRAAGVAGDAVELHGGDAQRFLYNYAPWPAIPPGVPRLITSAGQRYYLVPNNYVIAITSDDQWNLAAYLGVPIHEGDFPEALLANQPLVSWHQAGIDIDAFAAAVAEAVGTLPVSMTTDDRDSIVSRISVTLVAALGGAAAAAAGTLSTE